MSQPANGSNNFGVCALSQVWILWKPIQKKTENRDLSRAQTLIRHQRVIDCSECRARNNECGQIECTDHIDNHEVLKNWRHGSTSTFDNDETVFLGNRVVSRFDLVKVDGNSFNPGSQ